MTQKRLPSRQPASLIRVDNPRRTFVRNSITLGASLAAMSSIATGPSAFADRSKRSARTRRGGAAATVTIETFQPLRGSDVTLVSEAGLRFKAILLEVNAGVASRRIRRQPFFLIFEIPESAPLEHGAFQVQHAALGSLELFMSPVDLPSRHRRLEAVLS